MERYDVAIIGTGPAGLEAALTLKNRNKNILLLGNDKSSDKVFKAHEIKNYLGLPNIKGEDFSKAFIEHIKIMGIKINNDVISQIYNMGDYFALQGHSKDMYEAKSIIIATGVKSDKPYVGEEEYLGRGVSYCATCDAPLYKNKNIAVILESNEDFEEVRFLSTIAKELTLIPLYEGEIENISNVKIIKDLPIKIEGKMKANKLILEKNEIEFDGLFILKKSVPLSYLLSGLEMDEQHIKVNRQMETNIKGVFACGDITGKPYQYIKAAGEGNVAALSAVNFLAKGR